MQNQEKNSPGVSFLFSLNDAFVEAKQMDKIIVVIVREDFKKNQIVLGTLSLKGGRGMTG